MIDVSTETIKRATHNLKDTWLNTPKFKCSYCEKMLKSKRVLDAHERDHTGEIPFECNDCGKGFKSNSVLITHRKHVHKILTMAAVAAFLILYSDIYIHNDNGFTFP